MATHSSILAWRVPWTEEPGGTAVHGSAESDATEHTHMRVTLAFRAVCMSVDGACASSVVNPRDLTDDRRSVSGSLLSGEMESAVWKSWGHPR